MTVVTSFPGSITHAGQLGGGSGKHASACRRRCAIALTLLRQYTETTNYERDKRTTALLKPNAAPQRSGGCRASAAGAAFGSVSAGQILNVVHVRTPLR